MRAALGVLAWAALGLRLSASHKEAETRAAAPNIDKVPAASRSCFESTAQKLGKTPPLRLPDFDA